METTQDGQVDEKRPKGRSKLLMVGLAVVVVCALAGVFVAIYFTILDDDDSSSSSSSSGGGGGTAQVNLEVSAPSALNNIDFATLVNARESTKKTRKALQKVINPADFPASSDFHNDPVEVYVQDQIQEPINQINNIICYVKQVGVGYFMPLGDNLSVEEQTYCYLAQVDESVCEEEEGGGGGEGEENNGGNTPSLNTWTVCATNNLDEEQFQIRFWLDQEEDGQDVTIAGKMYIDHAAVELANENGDAARIPRWDLSWWACADHSDNSTCLHRGYITMQQLTGDDDDRYNFGLSFWQEFHYNEGNQSGTLYTTARGFSHSDNDVGVGVVQSPQGRYDHETQTVSFVTQEIDFAFEDGYLIKQTGEDGENVVTSCLDRNNPLEQGHRYRMYDSNGTKQVRNTGQSIFVERDGRRYYGYASFWGVHGDTDSDGNRIFTDGTVVSIENWNTGEVTTATIRSFGGKLSRHVREIITVDDLANIPVSWYDSRDDTSKTIEWDPIAVSFFITHVQGENHRMEELDERVALPLDETTVPWGHFSFWSDVLGGSGWAVIGQWYWDHQAQEVGINYINVTGTTELHFQYSAQIPIGDETVPENLYCYENCPNATALAREDENDSNHDADRHASIDDDTVGLTGMHKYTFDSSNPVLIDASSGDEVVLPTLFYDHGEDQEGRNVGFDMFAATDENLAALACEREGSTNLCPRQGFWGLGETFNWQTSNWVWSDLAVLQRSDDTYITYEQPLRVEYEHQGTESNSGKDYSGNKFSLEVHSGGLCCLPDVCLDNNQDIVDCGSEDVWRWVRDFYIPEGSLVTDLATDVEYVIKALEIEQTMKRVNETNCVGLAVDSTIESPTGAGWVSPVDGTVRPSSDGLEILVEVGEPTVDCATFAACNYNEDSDE